MQYICRIRVQKKTPDFKTPFKSLLGFKHAVNCLRGFGSKAFGRVPKEDRKTLHSKAIKCIFVGYCREFKTYKLFNASTHKVFASGDVVFYE